MLSSSLIKTLYRTYEQPSTDVGKTSSNANEIVTYMKKRKYEEKSNALLAGRIEDVSFEKLNKTIDIYDMLKKQYENLIDDDLVDSYKESGHLTKTSLVLKKIVSNHSKGNSYTQDVQKRLGRLVSIRKMS